MTKSADDARELLDQLPIRGYEADGGDSLPLTRSLLDDAIAAIDREPGRMGAWRLVGAVLEARKAFKSHITLCNSHHGPLLPIADECAGRDDAVARLLEEHRGLVARLDELITFANRDKASSPESARALREAAENCAQALDAYDKRYRGLVPTTPQTAKRVAS